MSEAEKVEKIEKLPKPYVKFIWLVVSFAIAAVGYLLKEVMDLNIPAWLGAVYSVILMASIVLASQKASAERAALAENKEKKFAYTIRTAVYYLFIFVAVIYVFFSLWMTGILSF